MIGDGPSAQFWVTQCKVQTLCPAGAEGGRVGAGGGGMSDKALCGRGASHSGLAYRRRGFRSAQPPSREGVYIYSKTTAAGQEVKSTD